jgi:hypothetical protein
MSNQLSSFNCFSPTDIQQLAAASNGLSAEEVQAAIAKIDGIIADVDSTDEEPAA